MTSNKNISIQVRFLITVSIGLAVLSLTTTASAATFVKGLVPDWNGPYWHGVNGPNGGPGGGPFGPWQAWCTPAAAANVVGYWEDKRGHAVSDGAVYPASGTLWPNWPAWQDYEANGAGTRGTLSPGSADDIGWYMDTNRCGDTTLGNPGFPGNHVGTFIKDVSRPSWGAKLGLNRFFKDRGATGFRAHTQGVGYADGGFPTLTATQAWQQITREIDAGRPIMVAFQHWNIINLGQTWSDASPEGSLGWEYWKFGVIGEDQWGNGEDWDGSLGPNARGHYVAAVGHVIANSADDIWGNTNWLIVHDTVGQTARNIAVPFVVGAVPWLANTVIRGYTGSPYTFGQPESVDNTSADTGRMVSLKVDNDSRPHVGYEDWTNHIVKYATKSGGSWTRESVDVTNARVWGISMAITWDGAPRMAYAGSPSFTEAKDLWYASKSGAWSTVKAYDASSGNDVWFPALVLTQSAFPRIAYKRDLYDLWLSYNDGGAWTHTKIDHSGDVVGSNHNAIAIDMDGYLHVAYDDMVHSGAYDVEQLRYAENRCDGGVWSVKVVESNAGGTDYSVGQYPSVDLDSEGNITISHYALGEGDLRVAQKWDVCTAPEVWGKSAVDLNTWQAPTAVCYDSADRPVIAFWGTCSNRACIKIARWMGAAWSFQTAYDSGSSASSFRWLSMDLDAYNQPHIAFYAPPTTTLRYIVALHRGDLDGDGSLSGDDQDLLTDLLLDPSSATPEQQLAADCNGDGVLDGRDIQAFLDLVLS